MNANPPPVHRAFVIILTLVVQIPVELETLFVVLPHERPNREQLAEIAQGITTVPGEVCVAILVVNEPIPVYNSLIGFRTFTREV